MHWIDGEPHCCPCDLDPVPCAAAEGADDYRLLVDYDEATDQWFGLCSEHGEILRLGGTATDHDVITKWLARHDEYVHDGDGLIHWQMIIAEAAA